MLENIGESEMQKWHLPKNPGKYSESPPKPLEMLENTGTQQAHGSWLLPLFFLLTL